MVPKWPGRKALIPTDGLCAVLCSKQPLLGAAATGLGQLHPQRCAGDSAQPLWVTPLAGCLLTGHRLAREADHLVWSLWGRWVLWL